ncbi:DUF4172 domain-containing protein [Maridesulfovibrio sp.]|uniref:DUF4172 domain-containing protein n=1 Tax=Maridesulfovibrio sp. TaxID=2795000 RepID=UPI003747F0B4
MRSKADLKILTNDIVHSSVIEGDFLSPEYVRSPIADIWVNGRNVFLMLSLYFSATGLPYDQSAFKNHSSCRSFRIVNAFKK